LTTLRAARLAHGVALELRIPAVLTSTWRAAAARLLAGASGGGGGGIHYAFSLRPKLEGREVLRRSRILRWYVHADPWKMEHGATGRWGTLFCRVRAVPVGHVHILHARARATKRDQMMHLGREREREREKRGNVACVSIASPTHAGCGMRSTSSVSCGDWRLMPASVVVAVLHVLADATRVACAKVVVVVV